MKVSSQNQRWCKRRVDRATAMRRGVRGGFGVPPQSDRSGAALIVVLILMFSMAAIAGAFAYAMKIETRLSVRTQSTAELEWLGRSGVEFANWVLNAQRQVPAELGFDALNQFWAGGMGPTNTIDNPFLDMSLDNIPIGEGSVSIKIVDNERKLNINSLTKDQVQLVLQLVGLGGGDASVISDAIMDWRDRDDLDQGPVAAESFTYYLGLDPPHYAKNGPLDDISELLKIRGVTQELYWGQRRLGMGGQLPQSGVFPGVFPGMNQGSEFDLFGMGLVEILCAVSSGRVNVNTASFPVLQALFAGDEVLPTQIIQRRQGMDGIDGTSDDLPFRNIGELGAIAAMQQVQGSNLLVVQSGTFEIVVTARLAGMERRFRSVVRRGASQELQIMLFHPE
jgi:type II secretory pathway component PulK